MRFYAGGREPTGGHGCSCVAQFDATAMRHGFVAVAITSRRRNGLRPSRHIAIDGNDGQEREDEYSGQTNTEGSVSYDREKQRVHA